MKHSKTLKRTAAFLSDLEELSRTTGDPQLVKEATWLGRWGHIARDPQLTTEHLHVSVVKAHNRSIDRLERHCTVPAGADSMPGMGDAEWNLHSNIRLLIENHRLPLTIVEKTRIKVKAAEHCYASLIGDVSALREATLQRAHDKSLPAEVRLVAYEAIESLDEAIAQTKRAMARRPRSSQPMRSMVAQSNRIATLSLGVLVLLDFLDQSGSIEATALVAKHRKDAP